MTTLDFAETGTFAAMLRTAYIRSTLETLYLQQTSAYVEVWERQLKRFVVGLVRSSILD